MNTKEYPKCFFRGISNKDFIQEGQVVASAFQFDDSNERNDEYKELSINWEDDDASLEVLLMQKKENGKIQFAAGAAKVELQRVKMILSQYIEQNTFSYERKELDNNPYHGNLLLSKSVNKQIRSLVSSGLALAVSSSLIPQKYTE
ncbi:hypothetical protein LJC34_01895 [Oscillospiraceae bacterium OttesenSCG-928-G22]|nr:hypothetical protein [Oscillospiraceae bacterium OttesenSCG-928-G22]